MKPINKTLLVIIIILVILLVTQQMWVPWFVERIVGQKNDANEQMVGSDKDEHGCIGSAGYSWCQVKNKCLRIWEEKCE